MSHFAVVAPPYYSHFQALQALAVELIERGHRVTFFHQSDAAHWLSVLTSWLCTACSTSGGNEN